jgi:hypothetical protein
MVVIMGANVYHARMAVTTWLAASIIRRRGHDTFLPSPKVQDSQYDPES